MFNYKNTELNVYVISHARETKIPDFYSRDWIYIVGKGEKENYEAQGFKNVIEGGGLIESRNKALELADEAGTMCLQLSDDLGKIYLGKMLITLDDLIEYALIYSVDNKIGLLGINPVFNNFYQRDSVTDGFVIGDFTLTKPNTGIRYDSSVRLKEDYDFTLQYLARFGSAKRLNNVICEFKHYSNAGGAVEYRTDEREREVVEYLERKWGKAIKRNTKRKQAYEILIARDWYKYI